MLTASFAFHSSHPKRYQYCIEQQEATMAVFIITMLPTRAKPKIREYPTNGNGHITPTMMSLPSQGIIELQEALKKHGGQAVLPLLAGDVTVHASSSIAQLEGRSNNTHMPHGPRDSIFMKFKSIQAYKLATKTKDYLDALEVCSKEQDINHDDNSEPTQLPQVFAFQQNALYIGVVVPALKAIYKWLGYHVDCQTPAATTKQEESSHYYDLKQSNGDTGLENYKSRVSSNPNQRCYILQLLNKDTVSPHGKHANTAYTQSFVQAMFSSDQVVMRHCGNLISLDGGPKVFQQMYLLEFPSREMYLEWMESEYFRSLEKEREDSVLDSFVQLGLPVY